MTGRPYLRLPPDLACVRSDGGIAVRASAGAILLSGEDAHFVVDTLFPLLDGTRTQADLQAALAGIAPDDLTDLLRALREHGLLLDGEQPAQALPDASERQARLAAARVAVVGHAAWAMRAVASIRTAGVGHVARGLSGRDACDLAVGAFRDDDADAARDFARTARAAAIPSLACITGETETIIGPLALPSRSACWNCAQLRLRANAAWSEHADACEHIEATDSDTTDDAILELHLAPAARDAILLGGAGSALVEHVLVIDRRSQRTSLHRVLGVPGCGVCGGPVQAPRPRDGAADTSVGEPSELALQALSWFVDRRTGVVNRVLVEQPAETGLAQPIAAQAVTAAAPIETTPARPMPAGWGKGTTAAAALIGAVAEAIERYAGSMPDPARFVWSRPGDLSGSVLDPREFALYADDQHARAGFPFVRFDPEVAHPWIAGEWPATGDPVWIPALFAYLWLELRREHVFCQGSSNGLAAGTDPSEAGLRAILELLERDAFMTCWRCRRPGRRLRLDDTLEAELATVVSGLAESGAQVELVLLESVGGYPTAVCMGFGNGVRWPGVTLGLGCDPDARAAVRQAILELGQTGPYLRRLMQTAAHLIPASAPDVADLLDHARYYFPPERAGAFDFLRNGPDACALADLASGPARSLTDCAGTLAAAGVRVALIDVTSADVALTPFRVMRAVSPDLQPISFGYGLDHLPVPRLAALGARASEDEIAPIW